MSTVHGGQGNIVKNGLVLWLDAANPKSYPPPYNDTTWIDISGNNINGTLVNGPTYSSSNGGSIVFDGTNDYLQIPGNGSILANLTVYTFELLIKAPNAGNRVMVEKGNNTKMLLQPAGSSEQLFYGDFSLATGLVPLINNTWRNYCVVQDSTSRAFYTDGVNISTANVGNVGANSFDIVLMSRFGSFAQPGTISAFRLYNRALSQQEVLQNYNATRGRFLL